MLNHSLENLLLQSFGERLNAISLPNWTRSAYFSVHFAGHQVNLLNLPAAALLRFYFDIINFND